MGSEFGGLMRQNGTETLMAHLSSTSSPPTVNIGRGLARVRNTPNPVAYAAARRQKKKKVATMGDPESLILLAPVLENVSNRMPGSRGRISAAFGGGARNAICGVEQ